MTLAEEATVSVIIPYCADYTPESMLEDAIRSAEAQSVATEIIVVEDEDKRGPGWARNEGIRRAETRFIAFLDSDDLWNPGKLKRQLKKLEQEDVGLCVEGDTEMERDEFVRELLFGSIRSLTSSILIDTKKVQPSFSTDLKRFEDHLFLIEAATAAGICFVDNIVTIRKHDEGLSAAGSTVILSNARLHLADELESIPAASHLAPKCRQVAYYIRGRQLQRDSAYLRSLPWLFRAADARLGVKPIAAILLIPWFLVRDVAIRVRSTLD
ncbi:glycosyltransferase family 2 protein [Halostella sp. JP-L12]|uniref:glycosyltransferase family 2 protein n=1 Tax=Halostella TaxID=1843185 RepID=UPI000EF81BA3|nr:MULTISPECIES: glycosyltransferase [Halostella]NHN46225.1 glycosyltransferase family 2 protein [Halostella sp. JP-L12]